MSYLPQKPPRKSRTLPIVLGVIGAVVLLCIAGIAIAAISSGDDGGDEKSNAAAAPTSVAPTTTASAKKATTTAPAKKATTTAPTKKAATRVEVPNGVGLDYQSAQDLWRAAGLIVAPATDATGAHRLPVIDRNWVVLKQSLKAGSTVPDGTVITATVKKFSDD